MTRAELLDDLRTRIETGLPVSFTKCGDGEIAAMSGEIGANCDGHPYSPELGTALREAFRFLDALPDVHVIQWEDQERYQALIHHEGWDLQDTRRFWLTARDCARPKVFVGPERLGGAATLLKAEHVVIPLANAFESNDRICHALLPKAQAGTIFIFCGGMPAKSWIAYLLNACPQISCFDAGSAFDPIFVGNTRTGQFPREQAWNLYADVLPPLAHAVIFSKDRSMQLDALLRSMARHASCFWPPTIFWLATSPQTRQTYNQLMADHPHCRWVEQLKKPKITDDLLLCLETKRRHAALFSDDDVFFRAVPRFEVSAGESFSLRFGVRSSDRSSEGQPCLGWSADGNIHPVEELRAAVRLCDPAEPNLIEPMMNRPENAVREKCAEKSCLVSIPHNLVQSVFPNPTMGGSAAELTERWRRGERIDLDAMDFSSVTHAHENIEYRFRRGKVIGVTVITSTGGRPEAFALCRKWMERQTWTGPLQWIVVDDCVPATTEPEAIPSRPDWIVTWIRPEPFWQPGQNTLARNLLAAIPEVTHDRVLFMEDDDWYAPEYVASMVERLDGAEIAGEVPARYHNVARRMFWSLGNGAHASLAQTAISASALPALAGICRDRGSAFIDVTLWQAIPEPRRRVRSSFSVGIKGMPGRPGIGSGHRPTGSGWRADPDLSVLRSWIGDDAKFYEEFETMPGNDNVDAETGFEVFLWNGQRRYRCPLSWESGEPCAYDSYDLEVMRQHVRESHNRSGKAVKRRAPSPVIYDADGRPVTLGARPDRGFEDVRFKDE